VNSIAGFVRYPIRPSPTRLERVMKKLRLGGIARCPVCGSITVITNVKSNLRESCNCIKCRSTNRQRQLAYVLCSAVSSMTGRNLSSLKEISASSDLVIYNTEAGRAIHRQLAAMRNYICSEYFGSQYRSGDFVRGKMHQDLMGLSFEGETIDVVISSDVFEHIPDPYRAHKEVHRVLRPGGRHIFTVPFGQAAFLDERRTLIDFRGNIVHLKEPVYHGDPIRREGALVHSVFGLEMLVNLGKIGFDTNMYKIYKPLTGIVGSNAIVFEAVKTQ
jgi:SAM-dependent methyltransferase